MSLAWHEIRDHLMQSSSTLGFQRNFDLLRCRHESWAVFADPAALLDALHRNSGSPDEKNVVLAAAAKAAQSDGAAGDCALTLMLLALWPGLDAVRRRLAWRRTGTAGEVSSDILAKAIEEIRCLDLDRVHRIAATVLRNVERDIVRVHTRELRHRGLLDTGNADEIAAPLDTQAGLEHLHRDLVGVIGGDATLVIRVAVHGFSQAEVGDELGLSESAVRKRYQRAARRLRDADHLLV